MKILQLLEYSQDLRHSYLDALSKLPWEEFVKERGGTFDSLRNIYLHCLAVLDSWVNHLLKGNPERPKLNYDEYDSMEKIKAYLERVESDTNAYLSRMTPEELSRSFDRTFRDGSVARVTVEDTLVDFFQEETHHRGELIALLWQMNIAPPHMSWSKYLQQ
ncbi:MAG: DinB family protein [Desulfobacterales bacterium]|nr:DinB family protein [Desulfobacterales bacterium]